MGFGGAKVRGEEGMACERRLKRVMGAGWNSPGWPKDYQKFRGRKSSRRGGRPVLHREGVDKGRRSG